MNKQHIFEAADLGKAPFSLLKVEMREQDPEAPRIGTSCDYCGTYITNVFFCRSSDKKEFVIGSTCVDKLGDAGLTNQVKAEVKKEKQERRRIKELKAWEASRPEREAAEAERQAQAETFLVRYENAKSKLASLPHPLGFTGKSLLDYIEYCGGANWYKTERYLNEVGA